MLWRKSIVVKTNDRRGENDISRRERFSLADRSKSPRVTEDIRPAGNNDLAREEERIHWSWVNRVLKSRLLVASRSCRSSRVSRRLFPRLDRRQYANKMAGFCHSTMSSSPRRTRGDLNLGSPLFYHGSGTRYPLRQRSASLAIYRGAFT